MAELKTKATTQNPSDFLRTIEPESKRADSLALLEVFKKATGQKAVMWGTSIVGFGMYHYKSERSRQEGDWPLVGFSPRKQNLTLYIMPGLQDEPKLLARLGTYKVTGGCVYINKLADVDTQILSALISSSFQNMKKMHA